MIMPYGEGRKYDIKKASQNSATLKNYDKESV